MILEGRFEYKKALILTPERVQELEKILLKYSNSISYEGTTATDTEITFTSSEELFHYDNFHSRRLKSLSIIGMDGYKQVISCKFEAGGLAFLTGYDRTCLCLYSVSDVDTETTLRADIETFLKKSTARFWILGKIRVTGLLAICAILILSYSRNVEVISSKGLGAGVFLLASAIGVLIPILTMLFDKFFLTELFPPLSFLWGEAISRGRQMEKLRGNLFWVVVIGILMAILGSKIYEIIF